MSKNLFTKLLLVLFLAGLTLSRADLSGLPEMPDKSDISTDKKHGDNVGGLVDHVTQTLGSDLDHEAKQDMSELTSTLSSDSNAKNQDSTHTGLSSLLDLDDNSSSSTISSMLAQTGGIKSTVVDTVLRPLNAGEKKVLSSPIFHQPPLFYYRSYVASRSTVKKSVPIPQHYINERALRQKHYSLMDQISTLKHRTSFATRDLKHQILKAQNLSVTLGLQQHALQKRNSQREVA
jgi:hypothetical protein